MSLPTQINWHNIRSFDGQREGFEELVCQLAAKEALPNAKEFVRIGKPDGGKECFWRMSDGSQKFWQAKYFTASLSDQQWNQLEKSVKTAISNHPNISTYVVSIPIDRPDARVDGKKSMLEKWNERTTKWKKYAADQGMNVEFEWWGAFELGQRLVEPKNKGLNKKCNENDCYIHISTNELSPCFGSTAALTNTFNTKHYNCPNNKQDN